MSQVDVFFLSCHQVIARGNENHAKILGSLRDVGTFFTRWDGPGRTGPMAPQRNFPCVGCVASRPPFGWPRWELSELVVQVAMIISCKVGWWEKRNQWILLMVGRNPVNSPVEVDSWNPIIYRVLAPSQVVVWDFWTINSMNGDARGVDDIDSFFRTLTQKGSHSEGCE